jgi:hypothetical protein
MLNDTIKRAAFGFLLGMIVGNVIAFFTSGCTTVINQDLLVRTGSAAEAVMVQTMFSGVYGAIAMAGVSFYEIEEWSLLRTALTHFALITLTYIPIGLYLGWIKVDNFAAEYGIVASMQAVVYLIIFLIMHARYKAEVKKLNEMLAEKDKDKR